MISAVLKKSQMMLTQKILAGRLNVESAGPQGWAHATAAAISRAFAGAWSRVSRADPRSATMTVAAPV